MTSTERIPSSPPPFGCRIESPSRILGHSGYRLILSSRDSGLATCGTKRVSPGVSGHLGCVLLLEDMENGARARPEGPADLRSNPGLRTPGSWIRTSEQLGLTIRTERLVVPGEASELYVLRIRSRTQTRRRIRATLIRDIAFDESDGFDSHPVFSKLFLQTERIEGPDALLLSRRPRSAIEQHPVLLFAPLPGPRGCSRPDGPWCETDRTRLLGRKLLRSDRELVPMLGGTCGSVLDPILALRIDLETSGTDEVGCSFLLSVAEDRSAARTRLEQWQPPERVEHAIAEAARADGDRLAGHGLSEAEANDLDSLGAAILAADPSLRRGGAVSSPVRPQEIEALARIGISPGTPFVLAHWADLSVSERGELERALRYWSDLGLGIRAVVLHTGGTNDLPESDLFLGLGSDEVSPRVLELVGAMARILLPPPSAPRPVLGAAASPSAVVHRQYAASAPAPPLRPEESALEFDNGMGGFVADGTEYVIRLRRTEEGLELPPRPWINVLANPQFGCLVSETGAGTTWYGNSRENRITPWRNDPVLDPHDEAFYLLDEDEGRFVSAFPGPLPDSVGYEVRHGFGYTSARHDALGLEVEALVFVPVQSPCRVTRIRLRNPGPRPRRISVASFAALVLGPSTGRPERHVTTGVDRDHRVLLAQNRLSPEFGDSFVFATATVAGHLEGASFTCDRSTFLGPERNAAKPTGLSHGQGLDGKVGEGLDPCFAQLLSLHLEAGDSCEVSFILGAGENREAALRLASAFDLEGSVDAELGRVRSSWTSLFGGLQVQTPSRGLDLMVNGWLPYQTLACRIWGRSAHYQSGGAFGFRDQLQDASSLVYLDPAKTREQILLHGAHQFVEGDVLHWWHPPANTGIRTQFVDDLLWLPLLCASYVEATGDVAVLEESLPLLEAPHLEEGEAERFLRPKPSGRSVDLYAHCLLAIDRSLRVGPNGLPLFGAGDWNDGMNRVGIGGTGESVWMAFFLISVIDAFLPHVRARGDDDRVGRYDEHRARLVDAIETAGWDGEWYRRGYFDDGTPLGSRMSDECRIDALVQAWSVLSGVAPPDRAVRAMESADRELVSEGEGIIRLLTPAFADSEHDPGYIKGYVAGVRENGGQYTHAALWLIRAFAALGRRDRVAPLLDMINPVYQTSDPKRLARYQLEPYVVAADVYGVEPHVGRGGWSWYTGSSGWMSRVAVESLLGFEVHGGTKVRLAPAIPDDWPGYTIRYRPRGQETSYEIRVENPDGCSESVVSARGPGVGARVESGTAVFELKDDGTCHVVEVRLGRASR